jgi:hypothetical protein
MNKINIMFLPKIQHEFISLDLLNFNSFFIQSIYGTKFFTNYGDNVKLHLGNYERNRIY